jgi:tryptophanyl-tRNA synthetase
VTPLGWLERVPTYKEALENVKDKDLHNYGFLGYPVLQCADIVIYGEPGVPLIVPVGEDQVSHLEVSREIVHSFNEFYGFEVSPELFTTNNKPSLLYAFKALGEPLKVDWKVWETQVLDENQRLELVQRFRRIRREIGTKNFFEKVGPLANFFSATERLVESEAMLTKTPRIPGLDGRKMSKSYGNAITLSESDADIRAKTKVMVTDPARKRRTDPGNPDVCPVYDWHKLFSAEEPGRLEWVQTGCRTAGIGCIECKAAMAENLIKWITPVRERRVKWENDPKGVLEILDAGSKKARAVAQGTMERVREAVFGWEKKRTEIDGAAGSAKA